VEYKNIKNINMKQYEFEKDPDGRWYIVLPEWTGDRGDLEMVCGADTMLDIMAQSEFKITLLLSLSYLPNTEQTVLDLLGESDEVGGGFYMMDTYKDVTYNLNMWLCDVTKFVFGYMPKVIYVSEV
jgi:hypothetical protein